MLGARPWPASIVRVWPMGGGADPQAQTLTGGRCRGHKGEAEDPGPDGPHGHYAVAPVGEGEGPGVGPHPCKLRFGAERNGVPCGQGKGERSLHGNSPARLGQLERLGQLGRLGGVRAVRAVRAGFRRARWATCWSGQVSQAFVCGAITHTHMGRGPSSAPFRVTVYIPVYYQMPAPLSP